MLYIIVINFLIAWLCLELMLSLVSTHSNFSDKNVRDD